MRFARLSRFKQDKLGTSAIEFALIAPLLILVALGIINGWSFASQKMDVSVAVKAGANYYLQGGTDDSVARTIALSAWPNAPSDGEVAVARSCSCGGVTAACSILCAGKAPPTTVVITAAATWTPPYHPNPFPSELPVVSQAVIRVR